MRKIDIQVSPQCGHRSVDRIKERILVEIIFRIEPFFLQFSPKRFSNVQMRRIWREKENIQTSFLPEREAFPNSFSLMYTRIIQYYKCFFSNLKRKIFQKLQNKLSINITFCCLPLALALPVYKTKTVNFIGFFGKYTDILIGKLPTVRNVSLTAYMRFISIIKVYLVFPTQLFKFVKFFFLKIIMFRQRLSFVAPSYSFISSAKLFKKFLKVLSLTLFPLLDSHSAFAVRMRCRLALMACKTDSLSSSTLIIRLRPRPGWVYNPCKPSFLYRLSQLLTLKPHIPVIVPTSNEVRPSDFNRILWQRIRKLWLLPALNPNSNSLRCDGVSLGVFTRPIMGDKDNKIFKTIF